MQGDNRRNEQDVIVLGLMAIYILAVGAFAVIRLWRAEYVMVILDIVLASVAALVFFYTLYSRNTHLGSYFVGILATIGTVLTVALNGVEQIYWAFPAVALLFYLLPPLHAMVIWLVGSGFIVWQIIHQPIILLLNILFTLLVTSLFCLLFSLKMHKQNNNLRKISRRDVMTTLHNRRAFTEDLQQFIRNHKNIAAIVIDLDNFKSVNDLWGHAKGDDVLFESAKSLSELLDAPKRLYRIGGDEFVVIAADMAWQSVCELSQSIHDKFSQSAVSREHSITLSMAVGAKQDTETIRQWLNRLDECLYQSKRNGRNQVIYLPLDSTS